MFKFLKSKMRTKERLDPDLFYYQEEIKTIEEALKRNGFIQQEYSESESVIIITVDDLLNFKISDMKIELNEDSLYYLNFVHCFRHFKTKERAKEVQALWVKFLIKFKKENSICCKRQR